MGHEIPISYGCGVCGNEVNSSEPIEDEYDGTWLCPKCAETYKSEEEIFSRAIEHYGEPVQVLKCIEELAELGKQLCLAIKADNEKSDEYIVHMCSLFINIDGIARTPALVGCLEMDNHPVVEHLISELADVAITTTTMQKMFTTPEEFEKVKQAKLTRLIERINGDDK